MNRKRLFKLFAALALLVAIVLVVSMATASQPDSVVRDPRYDQGPRYNPPSAGTQEFPHVGDNEQIKQLAPDSTYARWVAHARKVWNAQRSERQLPDGRTCVLLCGGR